MFYEFHPSSWTSAFPTTKPLTFIIYFSTLLYSISPVPTGAGDVLGQVTVEALESLHCGGGEDQDRCHKSQHFHQQSLLGFLSQLHDLMFCSFKSSQTPCFHIVHPTTEFLAIHVFLRTQNCGACSVLSVTDGVQPPTDWGSLWQEQAPHPPSTSTDCCKSYHAFPLSEASPWLQTCYVVSCDYRLHPDRYKPNSWDLDKVDLNKRLSIKILCRKLCSQKN